MTERIQALDPSFSPDDYPHVSLRDHQLRGAQVAADGVAAGMASGLAAESMPVAEIITDSVGHPDDEHIEYAQRIRQSIPETLYDAAHSSELAYLLTLALVLDRSGVSLGRQWSLLEERMGSERTRMIRGYYEELATIGAEYRLPLLEVGLPGPQTPPDAAARVPDRTE